MKSSKEEFLALYPTVIALLRSFSALDGVQFGMAAGHTESAAKQWTWSMENGRQIPMSMHAFHSIKTKLSDCQPPWVNLHAYYAIDQFDTALILLKKFHGWVYDGHVKVIIK